MMMAGPILGLGGNITKSHWLCLHSKVYFNDDGVTI